MNNIKQVMLLQKQTTGSAVTKSHYFYFSKFLETDRPSDRPTDNTTHKDTSRLKRG